MEILQARYRSCAITAAIAEPNRIERQQMIILRYLHRSIMAMLLACAIVISLPAAFLLRFEFAIPRSELAHLWGGLYLALAIKLIVFHLFRSDRGGWRYTSLADLQVLLTANLVGSFAFSLGA